MKVQRAWLPLTLALGLAAAAFLSPAVALGQTRIEELHQPLADFDARTGVVEPTGAQLSTVASLGAEARWNDFGTPQSLIKYGGYLATGVSGADAVSVAVNWLSATRALFRLSAQGVASLELVRDAKMAGSQGHAVIFRQNFGGLPATDDGIITVGVVGDKIAYVSSSLTGDTALTGQATLSATQAWLSAAADIGRAVSPADIGSTKTNREWAMFGVKGLSHAQRARLVGVPTPTSGVRPAFETLFIDVQGGSATAFRHFVDAATGEVLIRNNIVYQSHQAVNFFSGNMPQTDSVCDADQGPYVVTAGEGVKSIDVVAESTLTTNDVVLNLKRDGVVVVSADTLFSPEAIHYEPPGGVPPGSYSVQVCDFPDGFAWDDPTTYTGQIVFNPVSGTAIPFPPKWRVFEANPVLTPAPDPVANPATDTRKLWCWESIVQGNPVPGCELEVKNLASRAPWDHNVRTGTPTFTTAGNNANSAESWASPLTPGAFGQRPVEADREYDLPWGNRWQKERCHPTTSGLGAPLGNDILAATTNLFGMHNRMHDWGYFLGFTEENFNGQDSNFGNAGKELDPLEGDVQAGAVTGGFPSFLGRDNANMIANPDGVPGITNMYLWQPLRGAFYSPCVDGDYDMSVIGHEFGHMIEVRMIGKGGGRSGFHAGAMGESHADLMAMEYLNENSFVPVFGENPFAVGAYATGNKQRAIRNYGMNSSPLNFSDIGYDITGNQVHADGEIWSATNFDIRQALLAKYNASFPASNAALQKECADGKRPANLCPGNRRWMQVVFDAYLLMPTGPSMLDARNAQLAADVMRFGGANQAELWLAFARRGFGKGANSSNASANSDTNPKPDFASLLHNNATVTFKAVAVDEGNAPINAARIYVGQYEANVSPVADTNPSTSTGAPGANNLDDTAEFAPGTYQFVAQAPGYGHVRFTRTFTAGSTPTVTIEFPTNFASKSKGATASGDGTRFNDLIDDTEATNWERTGSTDVNVTQVTVDLAGASPVTVRQVNVSAMLLPGQNRFTALRKFRLEASTNGTSFTPVFISADDAFPGVAPRPAAPDMILRSFRLPAPVSATHVRIVVLTNQCTGNPQFQGVQDNDPLNVTDCRTGQEVTPPGSLAARDTAVRIAELQVSSRVTGGGGPPPPPPGPPPGPPGTGCEDNDLKLTGPATAAPGSSVQFVISYSTGTSGDDGCELDDLLPDDLTFVSATAGGVFDTSTRTVAWKLSAPAGTVGSVSFTAQVSPAAAIGAVLENRAFFGGVALSPTALLYTMVLP